MKLTMNASPINGRLEYSYAEYLDVLKPAGFNSVDFMLNDLVFDDSEMYLANTLEYCENIKRTSTERGFTVDQTHAPFQFKKWDDAEHFDSVIFPRLVKSLEMTALLGSKISVFHPLHHRPYAGHEEEIFELNMSVFKRLLPYAKEYDVKIALENMAQKDKARNYYVLDTCNSAKEFVRYVDTLDSEYAVACLDIGHVYLPSRSDTAADMIRALGHDRLKALHVHDNNYQADQHLLPFLGRIDWAEVTQALADIDYDGNFTFEVSPTMLNTTVSSFTPIGAKFMADVGYNLINEIERKKAAK